ncbi:unnamed protein product [Bursaphelenchus okinawaensis]|uniref:Protein kinase domain-containing protein n=1 Tax=Bursaphelenchus okinawaensis TaxID=465554 RepID=A0A811LGQ4_9BILA|nr:unnamed protein product [Bursaphelenchus okinawaensis]CAG9123503.1 unnamed protein product [Bursaphelenchus okinawaensis]
MGAMVHNYHIGNTIGIGAYGRVYECTDSETQRRLVMKVTRIETHHDGLPQEVLRELSALHMLSGHRRIVKMYDAFITGDTVKNVRIVFERCDFDLSKFLALLKPEEVMPEVQCKHFGRQILEGVEFLHSEGVIHRDLKPQNILVNRDFNIKLTDFGLARTYALHASYTPRTVTLWYRAPEVLLQCKYNTSLDIWSVGCIVAELFNRKPLFPGETETKQINLIFQKIGTPSPTDWPMDAIVDVHQFPYHRPAERFVDDRRMSQQGHQLLNQMLQFLPLSRPTATECLADYFKQ